MTPKPLLCPVCKTPVDRDFQDSKFLVWCTKPNCKSYIAGWKGGKGDSYKAAHKDLCAKVEAERAKDIDDMGQAGC